MGQNDELADERREKQTTTYSESRDVQDHKVQEHAKRDSSDKVRVAPHRQHEQTLVLRQGVHGVEHLDNDEDGQADSCSVARHVVREHLAADLREHR